MENEKFSYTYSARRDEEAEAIRKKYFPEQNDEKLHELRKLDKKVSTPGLAASLGVGIVGTLLLGLGMSCIMVWSGKWFIPGILIGIVGIAGIAAAYPLFDRITEKQRKKYLPEIRRLTDELRKK